MNPGMTYERMLAVLEQGGIDLQEFDKGPKSLQELFTEIRKGEATLVLNSQTKRVERHAKSVKIIIEAEGHELRETARQYTRTNRMVPREPPEPGASETVSPKDYVLMPDGKMHWSPLKSGIRCLHQEWGITPGKHFTVQPLHGSPSPHAHKRYGTLWYDYMHYGPLPALRGANGSLEALELALESRHQVDEHESKAYYGVCSKVTTAYLRLIMPRKEHVRGRTLKDENVYLILKWFPIFDLSRVADVP